MQQGPMGTNSPRVFALVAAAREAYGSLENPNYAFVGKAMKKQEYARLLEQLRESFEVSETTDENHDVAFCYALKRNSETLGLQISMIGPFSLILRAREDHLEFLVAPDSNDAKTVFALLKEHRLMVLSDDEIRHPIRMNMFDDADGQATLYQALFDSKSRLPWY